MPTFAYRYTQSPVTLILCRYPVLHRRQYTIPESTIIGIPGRVRVAPLVVVKGGPVTRVPPGTKARAKLHRWPEDEVSCWPSRLALAATALACLGAGILIGRFLLP